MLFCRFWLQPICNFSLQIMNLDTLFWNNQFPGLFTNLEGNWIIKPIKSFIKGHVANSIKNKLSNCISTIFINQALLNFIFENLRSFMKNLISFIIVKNGQSNCFVFEIIVVVKPTEVDSSFLVLLFLVEQFLSCWKLEDGIV